jgi:hypothetical protein
MNLTRAARRLSGVDLRPGLAALDGYEIASLRNCNVQGDKATKSLYLIQVNPSPFDKRATSIGSTTVSPGPPAFALVSN